MLLLDFISPSAVAAAVLTSGLSSASAFSPIPTALGSFGISPNARIAMARSIVRFAMQAASRSCHASAFGFLPALEVAVASCPDSPAWGCAAGGGCCCGVGGAGAGCGGSLVGGGVGAGALGSVGCACAGALVGGVDGGVVDCCCANSKHD